jgi:hypothetical protein
MDHDVILTYAVFHNEKFASMLAERKIVTELFLDSI